MNQEKQDLVEDAREKAEGYFRRGEFYCSEAVFTTINEMLGQKLPPETVQLASGFPVGIGHSKCLCGAVTGGVMALGLEYGRTAPGAEMPEGSFPNSADLHNHIINTYGSTCCRVLTKDFDDFSSPKRAEHCYQITGDVAAWVMERLIENGSVEELL